MNDLSISPMRIWPGYGLPDPERSITVTADVFVDGRQMPDRFIPATWFAAQHETRLALAPLFTCGCLQFGCGGYHIAVERTPEAWVWRNRYLPFGQNFPIDESGTPLPWPRILRDIDGCEIDLHALDRAQTQWGKPYLMDAFEYRFAWSQVQALSQKMIAEIRALAEPYPHATISGISDDLTALVR